MSEPSDEKPRDGDDDLSSEPTAFTDQNRPRLPHPSKVEPFEDSALAAPTDQVDLKALRALTAKLCSEQTKDICVYCHVQMTKQQGLEMIELITAARNAGQYPTLDRVLEHMANEINGSIDFVDDGSGWGK